MDTAIRAFYHVPIVGWLTKDAVHGAPAAKYYFVINILIFYAFLVYLIGYPFVIVTALTATGLALTAIVTLTAVDLIDGSLRARRYRREQRRK